MKTSQIERWALSVIEQVENGNPIEDARVEVKAEFPEAEWKTARNIAGHANAARGEPILWLIGIDEKKHEITGVRKVEIADWWNRIESFFSDNHAPRPEPINVPYNGKTIIAILYHTDQPPYLVDNQTGQIPHREVTWREANSTRTANRSDLIKLLSPIQELPILIPGNLKLEALKKTDGRYAWVLDGDLFMYPRGGKIIVLSPYETEIQFKIDTIRIIFDSVSFPRETPNTKIIGNKLAIDQPADFVLYSKTDSRPEIGIGESYFGNGVLSILFKPYDLDTTLPVVINMEFLDPQYFESGAIRLRWVASERT